MPRIVQELYDLETEPPSPQVMFKEEETPQQGDIESWCPRTSYISLPALAKEAHEHLFCKQGSALIFCTCAGG